MVIFSSLKAMFARVLCGGFLLLVLAGLPLIAQVDNSVSQLVIKNWFEFEPDEEFSLDGSAGFLKDASTVKYYPTVANLFKFYQGSTGSLGLKLSWDRIGIHYADIIPKKVAENPFAYPVGNLVGLSIWIWSPGYEHELAAIFKREDGYVYSLKLAKLDFRGWKKYKVTVPIAVRRKIHVSGTDFKYFFNSLRIYTSDRDKVGEVYVFLDKMDVTEELYTRDYDGIEIEEIIKSERRGSSVSQANSEASSSDDEGSSNPN